MQPLNTTISTAHVVIPTHVLRPLIPDHVEAGTVFSACSGAFYVAQKTFDLLYEQGDSISRDAAEKLAHAALCAIGSAVAASRTFVASQSMLDKRFQDIVGFIQRNLSNDDLTLSAAARACNISERYLSFILQTRGTTFSQLLWDNRIQRATACLADRNMNHIPIQKVAYMAGFKSAPHFSRMFKAVTGISPQAFRERNSSLLSFDPDSAGSN